LLYILRFVLVEYSVKFGDRLILCRIFRFCVQMDLFPEELVVHELVFTSVVLLESIFRILKFLMTVHFLVASFCSLILSFFS